MTKKILIILAVLLVIVCGGLFYVNKVLLPVQVKGLIIKSAEEQLHRKVTFNELYYHPIKGVVITGFTVTGKETPEETFLSVKEASAQVMIWPLLKKQVIISSVNIDSPSVRLVRYEPDLWNFSDLLKPAAPPKPDEKPAFRLVVSGISITNGNLQVTDRSRTDDFTETVEAIDLHASLALDTSVRINGSLALPATQGTLKMNALYTFKDQSFKSEISARNIFVARYLRFAPPLPLAVRDLKIADADLKVSGNGQTITVNGNGTLPAVDLDPVAGDTLKTALSLHGISMAISRDGTLAFQGELNATGLAIALSDGKSLAGNLKASVGQLLTNKNSTEFAGNVEINGLQARLGGDKTLEGNLKVSVAKLFTSPSTTEFAGGLETDGVQVTLDQAKSLRGALRLNNATFSLKDGRYAASGDLVGKNLEVHLDNGLLAKGELLVQGFSAAPSENGLAVKGEVKLTQAILSTAQGQTLSGDFAITHPAITIEGPNVVGQADLAVQGLKAALPSLNAEGDVAAPQTTFSFKNGVTELAAQVEVKKLHVATSQNLTVNTAYNTALAIHLKNDPAAKVPLSYAGTLDLNALELAGLPTVDRITGLTGKIEFETDRATTQVLMLSVLDTAVKVSGEVSSFTAPQLNVDVNIDSIDLALLEKVAPQLVKEQGLTASGKCLGINAHIEGSAADIAKAKIRAQAELKEVSAESTKLKQKVEKVSGFIAYDPPSLAWKDLHLTYQGKDYVLNGHLQDFANPTVAGSLKTADLMADFQVKKQGEQVTIERLDGSYFESTFDITGEAQLPPNAEPTFAAKGEVKLALKDLPKILPPEQVKQIEALKLAGILKIKADIKGRPTDWMNWTSNVLVDSSSLSAMGYEIENLRVSATQKDGLLDPLTVDGDFYEGVIHATTNLDLKKTGFPVKLSFKLDAANLAKLKQVTPLKDRRVEGLLNFTADVDGILTDVNSLKGSGSLAVKEGYLFDVPGLSILGSILQTSAKIGDIAALNTVSATWQIEKGRVSTDDLHIKGAAVDILGQGWVSLDQNLDMTFKTTFLSTGSGGGVLSVIEATGAAGELTGVRLYGPLSNPKKEFQALNPAKVIPNVLKNTADSLLKIFQ